MTHDRTPVVRASGAGANPTAEAETAAVSVESARDSRRNTAMSRPADAEALVDRLLGRAPAEPVTGVYRVRLRADVAALEAFSGELLDALETIGDAVGAPWDDAASPRENAARVLDAVGRGR